MTAPVYDPIYSEAIYSDALIDPDTYGLSQFGEDDAQSVVLGLIDATAATFTPTVVPGTVEVLLGLLDQTAVAHGPTVVEGIEVPLLDQAAVIHEPTVGSTAAILLAIVDQTAATFEPTIEVDDSQDVVVGLLDQTASPFTPTVVPGAVEILLALIDRTAVAHQPSATHIVTFARIDQTATTFDPDLSHGWFIDQTAVAFAPSTRGEQVLAFNRIGQLAVPHSPRVTEPEAVNVDLDLIDRTAVAAAIAMSGQGQVILGLIDRTAVAHAPVVVVAALQQVLLQPINQTAFPLTPTISGGALVRNLTIPRIFQQAIAQTPTIIGPQGVALGLINRTASAFSPSLAAPGYATVVTPAPPAGTPARVIIDGVDHADVVVWRATELETAVSGNASNGVIVIRDIGQTVADFVVGSRVHVDFGEGTRPIWSGYLQRASRRFWFPVDDPDKMQRQWRLAVVDISILFKKRTVYKKADPADVTGPKYTSETYDDVALGDLFADWLDLDDDDLDLTTEVQRVGVINPGGQVTYPWNGGMTFGEAVRNIAQIPAAVWGINPSRQVVYADANIENAPFALTDSYVPIPYDPTFDGEAFDNTVVGGWGTQVLGAWYEPFPSGDSLNVADGIATMEPHGWMAVDYSFPSVLEMTLRFRWPQGAGSGTYQNFGVELESDFDNFDWYVGANVRNERYNGGAYDLTLEGYWWGDGDWSLGPPVELTGEGFDLSDGGFWAYLKVRFAESAPVLVKYWKEGDPEPDWQFVDNVTPLPAGFMANINHLTIYSNLDNNPTVSSPLGVDSIAINSVLPGPPPEDLPDPLADVPTEGYREAIIYPDGSRLVNDYLAWGAGKGSDHMVFDRRSDAASIAEHGLWQESLFTGMVWKQATIEKITDSAINGSPGSRRGGKDDRYEVRCVTHANGLVVGDRVRFRSLIWGYEDVLPVRKARMTFPTPTDVRYELTLSHELDRWGFEDPPPPIDIDAPPLIDLPPIAIPEIADECITTDYLHDLFTRVASGSGPFLSTANLGTPAAEWGNDWRRDPDLVTGSLIFPGDDVQAPNSGNPADRVNKVSAVLNPATSLSWVNHGLVVQFDSHSAGGGPALDTHGVISSTSNDWRGVSVGPFEDTGTIGVGAFVYYWFGGPYNGSLSGSGSYSFYEPTMGSSGDSVGVSNGVAWIEVTNGHYGVARAYTVSSTTPTVSAWAHPISTGRFKARFTTVPASTGPVNLRVRYGPADLIITPSSTETLLQLRTGSGSSFDSFGPWSPAASFSSTYYTVEMAVDLDAQTATARVYSPTGVLLSSITRALNGETVEGLYEPSIGFRLESTTSTTYRFETSTVESSTYSQGEGVLGFGDDVSFSENGWGGSWVTRQPNGTLGGPTDGLEWAVQNGYGIIRTTDRNGDWGSVEQQFNGSSVDLSFSLSNYPSAADILMVYFGASGFTRIPRVWLGSTVSMTQGTGSGATVIANTTIFNSLQPVNVRIRWSTSGFKVWLWASGTEQPEEPTMQHARNTNLPGPMVVGFEPGWENADGGERWIGPVDEGGGNVRPMFGIVGHISLAYGTGVVDYTSGSTTNGRKRWWPSEDPNDGRAYGVGWGVDGWEANSDGPEYWSSVVWGQFGNLGPGVPLDRWQFLRAYGIPLVRDAFGTPFDFEVIVSGECGLTISGYGTGTGVGTAQAAISTWDYGTAGLPTPGYNDEFINGARTRAYVSGTVRQGGVWNWIPFSFTAPMNELGGLDSSLFSGDGGYRLILGVHMEGANDILRDTGPYDANGFLTAHIGRLIARFRNLKFKLRLLGTPVIGLQPDPCPPTEFIDYPVGEGTVSQSEATPLSSTMYQTHTAYEPFSLVVFVNGAIQRWGIDFVETDPAAGTFTFSSPPGPSAHVYVQFQRSGDDSL